MFPLPLFKKLIFFFIMANQYISQKERIYTFLKTNLLPAIEKKDIDYSDVVKGISMELGVSNKAVEEAIKTFIDSGTIKHISILTIPDEKVSGFIKDLIQNDKDIKNEVEEVFDDPKKSGDDPGNIS